MSANLDITSPLNEQQVLMLRLLKNPLPEKDFLQMRKLAVKLLSKKVDQIVEDWEKKNSVTQDTYKELNKGHFRSKS
ncbi:MAG: hypothetical protein WBP45_05805 [Daejeonella sp.]